MTDSPSRRVVQQRIRNRMMEMLELASSFEAQLEYQRRAPVNVANEVINQWEDWCPSAATLSDLDAAVFSSAEVDALRRFHDVWERVAATTPDEIGSIAEAQQLPPWRALADAAAAALRVLQVRGRLPED